MSDETFAAPTSSQTGAVTPAGEGDYDAICAAVMETVRGRWFLSEYSRRNRHADTQLVLVALDRIERGLRDRQTPESVERLRNDLTEMARSIARAKAEIAGVSAADEDHPIGDAGLDSVVRATEEATSNILAAAAQIQEVAWTMREQGNDARLCDQLSAYATTIQTAATSQKLAGERTQKVVDVMRDLEGRINDMIDVWGGYPSVDNRLLANSTGNTPALPPADFGHVEIDTATDVEHQQNSSDEHDASSQDFSTPPASREESSPRGTRYLNDNGRAGSTNGHVVLDPGIAAAIRDAASLTNPVGADGNTATTAEVAEVKDKGLPSTGTRKDEASDDAEDVDTSNALQPTVPQLMQDLPHPQAMDGSHDVKKAMDVGAPEKSEPRLAETTVSAHADGETISPQDESAPPLEDLSEPVAQAGRGEASTDNAAQNPGAGDAGTDAASPGETTLSERVLAEATPSWSGSSSTIIAPPPNDLEHRAPVAETAAESDEQLQALAETPTDAQTTRGAEADVESPATPRPFVVIDLEPLPIGLDTQASPSAAADTTTIGSARVKEASPPAGEPKPFGWLSEPVTALYDLPPLEVPAAAQPSTNAARTSESAADEPPTKQLHSGSRWPFAFLSPRLRTKPTAPMEPAPTETTAPPPAVTATAAPNKTAPAAITSVAITSAAINKTATITSAVAFELGGLVVVAPPAPSEPRKPVVAFAPQPAASEPNTRAAASAALASEPAASSVAAVAAPGAQKPSPAAAAAPREPDAPVEAASVPPAAPEPAAPVVAAAAPLASELPAAAAVPAASEPSAPVVVPEVPPAPSQPTGPVAADGTPEKPATPNVKVLRPSPPPPSDPLAALAALSDEEKLALFS